MSFTYAISNASPLKYLSNSTMSRKRELRKLIAADLQHLINKLLHCLGKLKYLTNFIPTNINYPKLTSKQAQNIPDS